MASKNVEARRGHHPAPASDFVSVDTSTCKPNLQRKLANWLAKPLGRGTAINHRKIVRLNRVFRPRLEVEHFRPADEVDWVFTLQHVDEDGRHFVGSFEDVEAAFLVARAYWNRGVRVVGVAGGRP